MFQLQDNEKTEKKQLTVGYSFKFKEPVFLTNEKNKFLTDINNFSFSHRYLHAF